MNRIICVLVVALSLLAPRTALAEMTPAMVGMSAAMHDTESQPCHQDITALDWNGDCCPAHMVILPAAPAADRPEGRIVDGGSALPSGNGRTASPAKPPPKA